MVAPLCSRKHDWKKVMSGPPNFDCFWTTVEGRVGVYNPLSCIDAFLSSRVSSARPRTKNKGCRSHVWGAEFQKNTSGRRRLLGALQKMYTGKKMGSESESEIGRGTINFPMKRKCLGC